MSSSVYEEKYEAILKTIECLIQERTVVRRLLETKVRLLGKTKVGK